ncbi:MAG TPA: hypothetical protein VIO59_00575 [Rhodanobacter sp.]
MQEELSVPARRKGNAGSWALIAAAVAVAAVAFGYVGGWLAPQRLTPARLVNQFQDNAGTFAGYRRNHAKGACVTGYFDSNGRAQAYSTAQVFAPGARRWSAVSRSPAAIHTHRTAACRSAAWRCALRSRTDSSGAPA